MNGLESYLGGRLSGFTEGLGVEGAVERQLAGDREVSSVSSVVDGGSLEKEQS